MGTYYKIKYVFIIWSQVFFLFFNDSFFLKKIKNFDCLLDSQCMWCKISHRKKLFLTQKWLQPPALLASLYHRSMCTSEQPLGCFVSLWSIIRRSAVRNKVSLFMLQALVKRGIPFWDCIHLYLKRQSTACVSFLRQKTEKEKATEDSCWWILYHNYFQVLKECYTLFGD